MLLDQERIYLANLGSAGASDIRVSTFDDPNDFPSVATPSGLRGMLMSAGRGDGDYISGMAKLGTVKFIFKTRSTYRLIGDSADTWDLQRIWDVGCIAHRTIANCGGVLVWTDGRSVYAFDGNTLNDRFGYEVEAELRTTPLEQWPTRCAVYHDGKYILWYSPTACVVYDFRSRSWHGPWEGLPARVVIVDRDTGEAWVGSSVAGEIWRIQDGIDDAGAPIAWEAETGGLAFGLPDFLKRARSVWIRGDGSLGDVTLHVVNEQGNFTSRTVTLSGAGVRTVAVPVKLDGAYLMLRANGTGRGRIYELGLRADPLRRVPV
jgi:hypothetical protein